MSTEDTSLETHMKVRMERIKRNESLGIKLVNGAKKEDRKAVLFQFLGGDNLYVDMAKLDGIIEGRKRVKDIF